MDQPRRLFVIVLIGLPASGKTSWCQKFYPGFTRLDGDTLKTGPKVAAALEQCLQNGNNSIVDATNTTLERRRAVIEVAQRYSAWILGVVFKVDAATCVARAKERAHQGGSKVPAVAIYNLNSKYQPPAIEEGFHVLVDSL